MNARIKEQIPFYETFYPFSFILFSLFFLIKYSASIHYANVINGTHGMTRNFYRATIFIRTLWH